VLGIGGGRRRPRARRKETAAAWEDVCQCVPRRIQLKVPVQITVLYALSCCRKADALEAAQGLVNMNAKARCRRDAIWRAPPAQVGDVTKQAEARLSEGVTGAAIALLDSAPPDLWPRAQSLHSSAVASANEVGSVLLPCLLGSGAGESCGGVLTLVAGVGVVIRNMLCLGHRQCKFSVALHSSVFCTLLRPTA